MKLFGKILLLILAIVLVIGGPFISAYRDALFNNTAGVTVANSETNKFHATKTYTEGMATDLAKQRLELKESKDPEARKAIVDYITTTYASLDPDSISDPGLAQFLRDVRNGEVQ